MSSPFPTLPGRLVLGPPVTGTVHVVPVAGAPGEQGPPGPTGDPNPVVDWFFGHGPPNGTIVGAALGDMYQDVDSGLLYQLR